MNTAFSKRLKVLAAVLGALALIALLAVGWMFFRIRASLPQLDGEITAAGLVARTTIERDGLGIVTITGDTRADVAWALGYAHAQDRYFQMDVLRRAPAGELSAMFGKKTLPNDRAMRLHGFRKLAQTVVSRLPADQRAVVDAYTAGVNAGLGSLRTPPFEYVVARIQPRPWTPEDTVLVSYAMLVDLQDAKATYERTLMTLRDQLGTSGFAFFAPLLTPADAALDGSKGELAPIPGPGVINLRAGTTAVAQTHVSAAVPLRSDLLSGTGHPTADWLASDPDLVPGSNAFALSGAHTATGAALLASDMHLGLRVPNIWYRASLRYAGRTITGLTLPGVPVMVAGSNGHVAWSFTNAYVDTSDLVRFDANPVAPHLYRIPNDTELARMERRSETIEIKGSKPYVLETDWTVWGPVVGVDPNEHQLAHRWTGHMPEATNLELIRMEEAKDVTAAVQVAHASGIPAQNILVADSAGHVAWTIAGRLPRRVGYDGRLPAAFQFGDRSWDGLLSSEDTPVVTTAAVPGHNVARSDGRLWSANQRMIGGEALALLGDGGYARPSRARQIRDSLAVLERATPKDLLAIQLDDRALFLEPWYRLLMRTLTPQVLAAKEDRRKLHEHIQQWEGRASVDAISYPVARMFRIAVYTRVFQPIFQSGTKANPGYRWNQMLLEQPLWRLLEERPMHLLDPQYATWDDLLVAAVDDVINDVNRGGVRLKHATWGHRNRAEIRHPFSYGLPGFLGSWLDMLADPLPGDVDMPRVQGPTHGASERFVVSPGREAEGICHMPGGQSGHPLSPFYRAGHEAWAKGEPTPFLPGPTQHTLVLKPR